uniref:Uncharacterized protein n=1 Tax=viral metagenome TaxID=1070528 RepID=A0A6H1ZNB0_9ZZZZ
MKGIKMKKTLTKMKKEAEGKVETCQEFFDYVAEWATKNGRLPIGDSDPLGIVIGDFYYCLGDPSSTLAEMINDDIIQFPLVSQDEIECIIENDETLRENGIEKISCDSQDYFFKY